MNEVLQFIKEVDARLSPLHNLLQKLAREEEQLDQDILVKQGFLLHRYSIRKDKINKEVLQAMMAEFKKLPRLETEMQYEMSRVKTTLLQLENEYNAYNKTKLSLKKIFTQTMNNAFALSQLAMVQMEKVVQLLNSRENVKGRKIHHLILSLEKMTTQILKFINLVEQLSNKVEVFANNTYGTEKMYGRMMSKKEYRKTQATGNLDSEKDPTPVFDCQPTVYQKLAAMSDDERRNFFRAIGIRSAEKIVFFRTNLKPLLGPIPQSNGLLEYKFPKGIPIKIVEAA